ncbi:protein disulfide isomerase [Tieghemostelium lacteum]|uniref:Protein disulfide isomerase n=1 Tax=Tieghemostelium lacteum TaxID=361077 RepID=A0A152A3Y5_TIELA|nr:protein disulfide isomerase [Tieghemostelium lacteum]|eukprot:KYR00929.1 protein disulfide isomerase [Tieghemostelium lacteum]
MRFIQILIVLLVVLPLIVNSLYVQLSSEDELNTALDNFYYVELEFREKPWFELLKERKYAESRDSLFGIYICYSNSTLEMCRSASKEGLGQTYYFDRIKNQWKLPSLSTNYTMKPKPLEGDRETKVLELTNDTFHSIVSSKKHVFVQTYVNWKQFDYFYKYTFSYLADLFRNNDSVILARLNCGHPNGKYDISSLCTSLGYKQPNALYRGHVMYFSNVYEDGDDPINFDYPLIEISHLYPLINSLQVLKRQWNGYLENGSGLINEYTVLSSKFIEATDNGRLSLLQESVDIFDSVIPALKEYASYYIQVMKEVMNNGTFYIDSQKVLLNNKLESNYPYGNEYDQITIKLNILNTFKN